MLKNKNLVTRKQGLGIMLTVERVESLARNLNLHFVNVYDNMMMNLYSIHAYN